MSRIRITLLSLVAVLSISAIGSASASAAFSKDLWENTAGPLKAALPVSTTESSAFKLGFAKGAAKIECAKVTSVGASFEAEGKGKATELKFETCTVAKPEGCKLKEGTIKTVAVTTQLEAESVSKAHQLTFKPTSGEVFAEFTLEGTGCATLKGLKKVKGKVTCGTSETEAAFEKLGLKHKISCAVTEASKELLVGEEGASFEGSVALEAKENYAG